MSAVQNDFQLEGAHGYPQVRGAIAQRGLLGYEEQMVQMLRQQNPGLARRFSKENAFYFDDYDENELLQILNLNVRMSAVEANIEYRQKALDVLRGQKNQANFGNAGSVELLVKGSILRAAQRSATDSNRSILLTASDIADPGTERKSKLINPLSLLDDLYRMGDVKQKLDDAMPGLDVQLSVSDRDPFGFC